MKTVYKYPVPRQLGCKFPLLLPLEFKFLRIGFQGEALFLWAEVNKDMKPVAHQFGLFGTGHDIPNNAVYLATYDDGPFVVHLYRL